MFTGLIHHTGTLRARGDSSLTIEVPAELRTSLREGDSVAVNGVCLTAVRLGEATFDADLLPATLADTTLGSLPVGATVNLEPALRAGDPLGGHLVQGHVDGTSELHGLTWQYPSEQGLAAIYTFALPDWLSGWIVPKGSICIDGVSLTVQWIADDYSFFQVELIAETLRATNLGGLEAGRRVNLEADLIVKTISQLMQRNAANNSE